MSGENDQAPSDLFTLGPTSDLGKGVNIMELPGNNVSKLFLS